MIEKYYEEKQVIKKVCVKEVCKCDVCNKEIKKSKGYYHVTTEHNDWGNDSCESIENYDICSENCLNKIFQQYIERSTENENNTEYFEVNHENE